MVPQTPHNKRNTTASTPNGRTPLDQRHYSLLNWRSDVVVIVTDAGTLVQHARYNDSGSPQYKQGRIPAGDVNGDGVVDATDTGIILGAIGGAYDPRYDLNLDGPNETRADAADLTIANNNFGDTLGHNALSLNPSSDARGGHRLGYTGHTHADFNHALVVMRNRWYSSDLGRFVSRDPMGFVDGKNVYGYARGNGVSGRDPMGLLCLGMSCRIPVLPYGDKGGGCFVELPVWMALSDQACCDIYKNQCGTGTGRFAESAGGVICCQGRMVACDWTTPFICGSPTGIPSPGCSAGNDIVSRCTIVHEMSHFDDIVPCDLSCGYNQICRPGNRKGLDPNMVECIAQQKELECLGKSRCPDSLPFDEIRVCQSRVCTEARVICYGETGSGGNQFGCNNEPWFEDECDTIFQENGVCHNVPIIPLPPEP